MQKHYYTKFARFFLAILIVTSLSLQLISCSTTDNPVAPVPAVKGKVLIISTPTKVKIWVDGQATNYLTGDTLELSPGKHDITLKKNLLQDTTFQITAVANQLIIPPLVQMKNATNIGIMNINAEPSNSSVYIDKDLVGYAYSDIRLNAGTYNVTVKAENFNDTTLTVVILANQRSVIANVKLSLKNNLGRILLKSTPSGAEVYANGSYTLYKTPAPVILESGNYSITLKKAAYMDTTFEVTLVGGQTIERNIIMVQKAVTIYTTPPGAKIFVNNTNTGLLTPAVVGLPATTNEIKLILDGYLDTTITVTEQQLNQIFSVELLPNNLVEYTVKIYESFSTAATPSGLMLSKGRALTLTGTQKDSIDIYYKTNGYIIASAKDFGLPRETFFRAGTGTELQDGVDSPVKDATWQKFITDTQTKYFYLYTADQHYVKVKIINSGGGSSVSNPAWVELRYYYNTKTNDPKF